MMGMSAAFRPRFRRGGADAEPQRDLTGKNPFEAASDDVGDEVVGELADAGDADAGDDAGDDAGEWLAYEFHAWSLESRVMLQQLLTVDQVVHSWQGTTLMVHESLEVAVDSLVDEVEETEKAKEAIARPIGPEDPLTAFELNEWPEALRAELMERLVQARVPHILDTEGDADPGAERGADDPDPDAERGADWADPDAERGADWADPGAERGADWADPGAERGADWADPGAERGADWADPDAERGADWADPDAERGADWADPGAERGADWADPDAERGADWADPGAERGADWADPGAERGATGPTPTPSGALTGPTPAPSGTPTGPTPTPSGRKSATCWSARRTRSGLSS